MVLRSRKTMRSIAQAGYYKLLRPHLQRTVDGTRAFCRACEWKSDVGYEATDHLAGGRNFLRHVYHLHGRARRARTLRTLSIHFLGDCPAGNCPGAFLFVFEKEKWRTVAPQALREDSLRRLHCLRARSDSFFTHNQKAARFAERNALRQVGKNVAILSQLIANRFRG